MPFAPRLRYLLALAALCAAVFAVSASAADSGSLNSGIQRSQSQDQALQAKLRNDQKGAAQYQGRIDELQASLGKLEGDLTQDTARLQGLQSRLRTARASLVRLRIAVTRDQKVLAAQLVGTYMSSPPDMIHVLVNAKGFADLLEQVDQVKRIGDQNTAIVARLKAAKAAVTTQAKVLGGLTGRQQALVAAATTRRDAVAQLKLAVVNQQYVYVARRNKHSAQLASLRSHRKDLENQLSKLQGAQARTASFAGFPASGGSSGYGFFAAAGTNYTVGSEPEITARLNRLGQALHLHLIGLSGYRTPQHSIEVGGFPNDPHTRGEASDTPGIEGVDEATLNRFGLTRPFAGAAEADHIQLVGSAR